MLLRFDEEHSKSRINDIYRGAFEDQWEFVPFEHKNVQPQDNVDLLVHLNSQKASQSLLWNHEAQTIKNQLWHRNLTLVFNQGNEGMFRSGLLEK